MTGRFGARIRVIVITDAGRRYLRMLDAGLDLPKRCRRGHVLSEQNARLREDGYYACRACRRLTRGGQQRTSQVFA